MVRAENGRIPHIQLPDLHLDHPSTYKSGSQATEYFIIIPQTAYHARYGPYPSLSILFAVLESVSEAHGDSHPAKGLLSSLISYHSPR